MVVNIEGKISIFIAPLTFVLHSIATFGVATLNESLIAFLFVHLSASTRNLTPEW